MSQGEGGGRPTKYKPAYCKQAKALTKLGATEREVAEFFDVDERTLNRWKHTHPKFCQSLKPATATMR
jgi:transposase